MGIALNTMLSKTKSNATSWLLFCSLGFLSGLPLILCTETLQAWYATSDHSALAISMLTFLTVPYSIKPCFALAVDYARSKKLINYWGLFNICALGLTALLAGIALLPPQSSAIAQLSLVALACTLSACLDIAVDSLRILHVDSAQQGTATSLFVASYRASWLLAGGPGLIYAQHAGWQALYFSMAALFFATWLLSQLAYFFWRPSTPSVEHIHHQESYENLLLDLKSWLLQPRVLQILTFVFILKSHEALVKPSLITYLLQGLSLELTQVGTWYKVYGFFWLTVGGILGGKLVQHTHTNTAILLWCLQEVVCSLCFALTLLAPGNQTLALLAIQIECFCMGSATSGVMILLSQACDKRLASSQYALCTSLLAGQRLLLAPLGGFTQSIYGWSGFWMLSLSLATVGFFTTLSLIHKPSPAYEPAH